MASAKVYLNHATVAKLLRSSEFRREINALARALAERAGDGAFVRTYTTDRGAAAVIVPTWRQSRDGALTRAAASLGLPVSGKK